MTNLSANLRHIIDQEGRTQKWVYEQMNAANPELKLNRSKFSQIVTGKRKITGDELLAFFDVMGITPEEFLSKGIAS